MKHDRLKDKIVKFVWVSFDSSIKDVTRSSLTCYCTCLV